MTSPTFQTPIGQALWAVHHSTYPDRLVPPTPAAHIARVKQSYLATLRSRGGGPEYIRLNSRVFYDLVKLIEWIEGKMEVRQ